MFWHNPYYWILIAPIAVMGIVFLLIGLYTLTGFSVLDLLSHLFNRGQTLTCWHCGGETPADRKTCRHCHQELQ